MRREPSKDNLYLRRRKRLQRRVSRGAPHPQHYTDCSPIQSNQEPTWQSK